MNKIEFISAVSAKLHEEKAKKPVTVPKQKFFITDGDGNQAVFNIQQQDRMVSYNANDVKYVVDAIIEVVTEAVRAGEEISIYGFGALRLHHRAARRTRTKKKDGNVEWFEVDERYVPKFFYGTELKNAAKAYSLIHQEQIEAGLDAPEPVYDDYDEMAFVGEYIDRAKD